MEETNAPVTHEAPWQSYESWTDAELVRVGQDILAVCAYRGIITPEGVPIPKRPLWRRLLGWAD